MGASSPPVVTSRESNRAALFPHAGKAGAHKPPLCEGTFFPLDFW